jgi:hypothetical protein
MAKDRSESTVRAGHVLALLAYFITLSLSASLGFTQVAAADPPAITLSGDITTTPGEIHLSWGSPACDTVRVFQEGSLVGDFGSAADFDDGIPGTPQDFTAKCVVSSVEGAASNTVTLTEPYTPGAPTIAGSLSGTDATINWDAVDHADSYHILIDGSDISSTSSFTSDIGIPSDSSPHSVTVIAYNGSVVGGTSNTLTFTVDTGGGGTGCSTYCPLTNRDVSLISLGLAAYIGIKTVSLFKWKGNGA